MNVLRLFGPVVIALQVMVAWSCSDREPTRIPDYAKLAEPDGFVVVFDGEVETYSNPFATVLSGSNLEQNLLSESTDMEIPESAEKRLLENGWETVSQPSPTIDSRDQYSARRTNWSVEFRREDHCLLYSDFDGESFLNGDLLIRQQPAARAALRDFDRVIQVRIRRC